MRHWIMNYRNTVIRLKCLTDAHEFTTNLKQQLADLAKGVDERFPENLHATIKDGKLSVSPIEVNSHKQNSSWTS